MAKDFARRDDNYTPAMLGVNDSNETRPVTLTTTDRIKVDSNSADGCSSVGTGRTAHESAGTKYQLPSASCRRVWIQSATGNGETATFPNGGIVVVGDTNVIATETTRRGKFFYASQGDWFNVSNTNLLYVDVTDNNVVYSWYIEI